MKWKEKKTQTREIVFAFVVSMLDCVELLRDCVKFGRPFFGNVRARLTRFKGPEGRWTQLLCKYCKEIEYFVLVDGDVIWLLYM